MRYRFNLVRVQTVMDLIRKTVLLRHVRMDTYQIALPLIVVPAPSALIILKEQEQFHVPTNQDLLLQQLVKEGGAILL